MWVSFGTEKLKTTDFSVIICEDELQHKKLLVALFHKLGIKNISMFDNTEDLLKHITEVNYTIIKNTIFLLDIGMPKEYIQGDQLCYELKKHLKTPIIATTGKITSTSTGDIKRLLDIGFDDILYKPFGVNQLVKSINKVLYLYR